MNNDLECLTCIKRKSKYCPNSNKCYETSDKPYYQNRIMLLEENKQLKGSLQTYEILLKTNVEENKQLKEKLKQKEDIIYKIKKCIEEKEEYYGDYMGDGNYTMYSMMGANNNRIPYMGRSIISRISKEDVKNIR